MAALARRLRLEGPSLVICWSLVFLCALRTVAQTSKAASQDAVRVLATVSPRGAKLSKDQLTALVDNHPTEISDVSPANEQPLVFAILLDISGSLRTKGEQSSEEELALELFRAMASPSNKGFLGDFNDELYLSYNPASVDSVVKELKIVGRFRGGTALRDAVLGAAKLVNKASKGTSSRRAVFVFTDGEDNASKLSPKQAVPELQKQGVPIFCVLLLDPKTHQKTGAAQALSDSTGGVVLTLSDPRESVPTLVGFTQNQYWLSVQFDRAGKNNLHSFAVKSTDANLQIDVPAKIPLP